MADSVLFDGVTHVQPGAFMATRIRSTVGKRSTVPSVVAIVGLSEGGKPQTPLRFTDPNVARAALRGGNLLAACEAAWEPSGEFAGANEIIAVRATLALQGTKNLSSLAAAVVLQAKTIDYGAWVNNIRLKVEDGSRATKTDWTCQINDVANLQAGATTITFDTGVGTRPANGVVKIENELIQYTGVTGTSVSGTLTGCKRAAYPARSGVDAIHLDNVAIALVDLPGVVKVTVENQLEPGVFEIGNNLGEAMTLRYTGSGTPAAVTVTMSGADAITIAATVTGASSDDFSLSLLLTQYDTMAKVVNAIDALANWEASLKCAGTTPSKELDQVTALEAKLASGLPLQLMRIQDAMVRWAADNSQYITFAVQNTSPVAPANSTYSNFSDGSDGTENAAAWTAALAALAPELDVLAVVAATPTLAYQVQTLQHVLDRVNLDDLKQQFFTGSAAGGTAQNAIDSATSFGSRYAAFFSPGIKRTDTAGALTTLPGFIVAAAAAGLYVGIGLTRPLTNIQLLAGGVETKFSNTEVDAMILAGVCPVITISGQGTFIRKAVTTVTGGEAFWHQLSNRRIVDFIEVDMTGELNRTYVGQYVTAQLLEGIKATVRSKLDQYAEERLLFSNETTPAYKNIRVSVSGSVVRVDFEAAVSQPADFILITAYFTEGATA